MTFYRSIFYPLYFIVPIFAGQSIFFYKKYRSFLHFSLILNTEGENFLTQLWHLWYISRLLQIKGQSYRNGAKRKGRPYFMALLALQHTKLGQVRGIGLHIPTACSPHTYVLLSWNGPVQNLHWKLRRLMPSFGPVLAVRQKKYFF